MTSRAQVQALQTAINRWSGWFDFSPLKVDGVTGKYTLAAVKRLLASPLSNPDQVLYDFITTPEILIGTEGLVTTLADAFNRSADARNMPTGKPIPVASRGAVAPSQALAVVGKDQTANAGMLGLGLPNWTVYSGGAVFALGIITLIVKRGR